MAGAAARSHPRITIRSEPSDIWQREIGGTYIVIIVAVVVVIVVIGAGAPCGASLELLPLPSLPAALGCASQYSRTAAAAAAAAAAPTSRPGMTQLEHGSWATDSLTGKFWIVRGA